MGALGSKPGNINGSDESIPSWVQKYIQRLATVEEYMTDAKESRVQEQDAEYKLRLQVESLLERTQALVQKVDDQGTRLARAEQALEIAADDMKGVTQRIDTTSSQLDALEIELRAKLGNDEALANEFTDLKIDLASWKAEIELKEQELKDEVLSSTDKCAQQQASLETEVDERLQLLLKRTQWSREEMQQLYNVAELPPHIEAKFLAADVNSNGCMSIKVFLEDKARSRSRRYKEE